MCVNESQNTRYQKDKRKMSSKQVLGKPQWLIGMAVVVFVYHPFCNGFVTPQGTRMSHIRASIALNAEVEETLDVFDEIDEAEAHSEKIKDLLLKEVQGVTGTKAVEEEEERIKEDILDAIEEAEQDDVDVESVKGSVYQESKKMLTLAELVYLSTQLRKHARRSGEKELQKKLSVPQNSDTYVKSMLENAHLVTEDDSQLEMTFQRALFMI